MTTLVRIHRKGQIVIDRSKFPNADDEYTPAQRRAIDARLDESEQDMKNGRTAGPFKTASEMIAHMKDELIALRDALPGYAKAFSNKFSS